jgi:hypothetical protein
LSGAISLYYGKDLSWDLANYHYYNPYAHLQHREALDYWPISFIHLFFLPTADFFSYFLINHLRPLTVVFLMGALQGLNIWFTYLIANYFVKRKLHALLLSLLGIYSAHIFTKLGGFENDHIMNIFVLLFVYLQLRYLKNETNNKLEKVKLVPLVPMLLSGFLLGVALSIKLTACIYVVGAIAANLILPKTVSNRTRSFFYLTLSMFFTYLTVSGYWMFLLWEKYHNPVFPFFNAIFHSAYFPAINFHYDLFLPKTLIQIIFYPIYFSIYESPGDQKFLDVRFAIVFLLFLIFGIRWVYLKWQGKPSTPLPLMHYWLFAFIIFSYIAWEYYFAIVRYIGVIALLAPLLIYLLLTHLIKNKAHRFYLLCFLYSYMVMTMSSTIIVRAPWYQFDYFNVRMPFEIIQKEKSLVLLAYPAFALSNQPKPQSYLVPFFPKHFRFIGIPFYDMSLAYLDDEERTHIQKTIDHYPYSIFLLTTDKAMPSFYQVAFRFGLLKNGPCLNITSDRQKISNTKTLICPVKKTT